MNFLIEVNRWVMCQYSFIDWAVSIRNDLFPIHTCSLESHFLLLILHQFQIKDNLSAISVWKQERRRQRIDWRYIIAFPQGIDEMCHRPRGPNNVALIVRRKFKVRSIHEI